MSTETQAKHLDGPWHALIGVCKIDHPDTSADVRGPGNEFIANCGCHDFSIANARIIAAAPEGYALADKIRCIAKSQTGINAPWAIPTPEEWNEVVRLAQQFFAKAEGCAA